MADNYFAPKSMEEEKHLLFLAKLKFYYHGKFI